MIQCTEKCTYQTDGICTLDHITEAKGLLSQSMCAYYATPQDQE